MSFIRKHINTILYGIYAGMAIGLGGLLNILANYWFSSTPWVARTIGSLLFPVGLTLVCLLGLNLYTGKIGYLLDNKKEYIGFLGLVYIGNILGSLIFGAFCLVTLRDSEILSVAIKISNAKMFEPTFTNIIKCFAGSVLCGVLVYIAIFCYKTFKNVYLKLLGIFLSIGLFVFLKFDHCVANMFYFSFSWSWKNPLAYLNIAIVTLGNSLGAIALNEGIKASKKLFKKDEKESL
jgi:formate/nitrite transporter FocA (FNT family)